MAAKKGKKQFQGADRRFRGDIWMDEKVSARTMYALKERGVKFPPGMNVRGTREFRDEFKRQLSKFKQEHAAKIAAIMGMEAPSGDKMVAHVLCNGGEASVKNFEYVGLHDCVAATKVAGGPTACSFGCMGFGTCVAACQFDAIHINEQGVAEVDKEKCTNCGACREACPRKLIVEVPCSKKVFVNCSNKDKGPAVTKVCANSCIGCGLCQRTCKFDAIHVVNNVAVIDYTKCKGCTMCAKACPRNAIEPIPTPEEKEKFKAAQKAAAEKKAAAAKAAAEKDAAQKAE